MEFLPDSGHGVITYKIFRDAASERRNQAGAGAPGATDAKPRTEEAPTERKDRTEKPPT